MLNSSCGIVSRWFNAERTSKSRRNLRQRLARFESLETREMLSINWVNETTNNLAEYNTAADMSRGQKAYEIVKRAIADWEAVIVNFNFLEDGNDGNPNNNLNNTFQLTIN
jgi:hypothetical protein